MTTPDKPEEAATMAGMIGQLLQRDYEALKRKADMADELANLFEDLLDHAEECEILGFPSSGMYRAILKRYRGTDAA